MSHDSCVCVQKFRIFSVDSKGYCKEDSSKGQYIGSKPKTKEISYSILQTPINTYTIHLFP